MHPALKVGIGTLTIGTIAGTGYASSYYLGSSPKKGRPITELINSRYEYQLLNFEGGKNGPDGPYWVNKWYSYKKDNATKKKGEDTFQLEDWTENYQGDLIDQLIEKCKTLQNSKEDENNPKLYSDFTKYCAIGVTIEEQARKDNLIIVNTDGDESFWTEIEGKLEQLTEHLNNLNLGFKGAEIGDKKIDIKMVKETCKDFSKKSKQIDNYTNVYSSFKEICTKAKE